MSEEAQEFVKDLELAKKEVHKLQQGNVDKINALGQFGKSIDPAFIANLKMDVFIESFLDEGAQLVYIKNLETRLRSILDNELKVARQEMLTVPKGLTIPKV